MTREPWDERSLAEWLQDGPETAPAAAIEAAVDHARAHPRRRPVPEVGIWRRLMNRMPVTEVWPRSVRERSLAMVVAVAMVVVAVAFAGAAIILRGQTQVPPIGASPSPSADRTTAPTGEPSPTAWPTVGASWDRITDGTLVGKAQGSVNGVIAGGPGVIAWGEVYAAGPRIWYSSDGRAWTQAAVEAPTDPWLEQKEPGSVLAVTPGGPGFVAVGVYTRASDRLQTGLVWTSTDGMAWKLVPRSSVFDDAYLGQVVAWNGGLIAFGCAGCGMESGPTTIWTSTDGTTWSKSRPTLPDGLLDVGIVAVGTDRLWGIGHSTFDVAPGQQLPRPTRISSADGITWTASTFPVIGYERLHALPDGLYLTVENAVWGNQPAGVYRTHDGATWTYLGGPTGSVSDLIRIGGQLVAVGRAGPGCAGGSGSCLAAAWRSIDDGATWTVAPLSGTPAGESSSAVDALAMLPDGTLVGVGRVGTTPATAAWISRPLR